MAILAYSLFLLFVVALFVSIAFEIFCLWSLRLPKAEQIEGSVYTSVLNTGFFFGILVGINWLCRLIQQHSHIPAFIQICVQILGFVYFAIVLSNRVLVPAASRAYKLWRKTAGH